MLIKILSEDKDYTHVLRKRRLTALGLLCVGLIGLVCYFLLVPDSALSDYARGFYLGGASGLTGGALGILFRTQYLMTHPSAQKRAKIQEKDERTQHINTEAAQFAGAFTVFAAAAALFVVLPISFEAFCALLCILPLYALAFLAARFWLSRKL